MAPGPRALLVLAVALTFLPAAHAQELSWRHDLAAARREASRSGRPLLYDFGTETCYHCKRLDATTFRVLAVVRLITDRFVPVKIDGEREEAFTQQLGITTFPALVVVMPNGKVLAKREGYADATQMMHFLEHALAQLPSSSPRPQATAAPGPPVLPEPPRTAKTPAPRPGDKQVRARELLRLARQDYEGRCYMACLERCRVITSSYSDLDEAEQARQLARLITADPDNWQRTCARLRDSLGELYFKKAKDLLESGQRLPAKEYLERVVEVSPGSSWAKEARELLGGINR